MYAKEFMNIFVIDNDYERSAIYLDLKRANKMLIESAQMLCTAININGGVAPYKSTHINHPCTVWTRTSLDNFTWLWNYANCLGIRYNNRTGRIHKTATHLPQILKLGNGYINHGPLTPFVNCTTNFKHVDNIFDAYKYQLQEKWENDIRTPIFE